MAFAGGALALALVVVETGGRLGDECRYIHFWTYRLPCCFWKRSMYSFWGMMAVP